MNHKSTGGPDESLSSPSFLRDPKCFTAFFCLVTVIPYELYLLGQVLNETDFQFKSIELYLVINQIAPCGHLRLMYFSYFMPFLISF